MILWLHIAGGVISIVAILVAAIGLGRGTAIGSMRKILPALAFWQTGTGGLLVFSGGSLLRVCITGFAYLSVMAIVYFRLRDCETNSVAIPNIRKR